MLLKKKGRARWQLLQHNLVKYGKKCLHTSSIKKIATYLYTKDIMSLFVSSLQVLIYIFGSLKYEVGWNILFALCTSAGLQSLFNHLKDVTFCKEKDDNIKIKMCNRAIAALNGLVAAICSLLYLTGCTQSVTFRKSMCLVAGYLTFDTFLCFGSPYKEVCSEETTTFVHHVVLLLLIFLHIDILVPYFAWGLLAEISNPVLHYSWFLVKNKQEGTPKFKIVATLLLFLFALRVIVFTSIAYIVQAIFQGHQWFYPIALLFGPILIMNSRWFLILVRKYIDAIRNKDLQIRV